jgi:hypothetical protein
LAAAVISTDNFAMKLAPHQLDPGSGNGLIGVVAIPLAVWSLVKALQSPLLRLVSSDIVWRDNLGNTSIGLMNGAPTMAIGSLGNVPTTWSIALVGDYNGDGLSDLLWRDNLGNTSMWFMNGSTVASTAGVGNIPTTWTVQSVNAEWSCKLDDDRFGCAAAEKAALFQWVQVPPGNGCHEIRWQRECAYFNPLPIRMAA